MWVVHAVINPPLLLCLGDNPRHKKTATHRISVDSFFLRSFTIQQIDKLPLKEDGGHLKGFLHSVEFIIQESIFQGQNLKKSPYLSVFEVF